MKNSNLEKFSIIEENQIHKNDTGSSRVRVFLLQRKILNLEKHLKVFRTDKDAIEALFKFAENKKKILKQIRIHNKIEYDSIILKFEKMRDILKDTDNISI